MILSSASMDYVQVAADQNAKFTIEYQEGGTTRHFRAKEKVVHGRVVDVLVRYSRGDAKWKATQSWQQDASAAGRTGLMTASRARCTARGSAPRRSRMRRRLRARFHCFRSTGARGVRRQPFLHERADENERCARQQRHDRSHQSGQDQQDCDSPTDYLHAGRTPQQSHKWQGRRPDPTQSIVAVYELGLKNAFTSRTTRAVSSSVRPGYSGSDKTSAQACSVYGSDSVAS